MDQFFQTAKPICNGYRIHLFYKTGKTLCIPEQIPELGKFTSHIVVWNTDIVPIAVFPRDHMEIRAAACDLCFITGIGIMDEPDLTQPAFFAFSPYKCALIFHSIPPHIRFWLLTAARTTSASIVFFSICEPRARASLIRLSIRRGFPWEWLWIAESAALSIMDSLPPAQAILA